MIKKDKVLEKDIQREICDWLWENGFFFWRSNNVPVFGRSNDGVKRFRALPKYTPKGLPDIIVIHKGVFHGIEVKRPNCKLRPEQLEFSKKVSVNGGKYHLAFSLKDVMNISDFSRKDFVPMPFSLTPRQNGID